jgi:NCAIR mutase (PurE)-related protein
MADVEMLDEKQPLKDNTVAAASSVVVPAAREGELPSVIH